MTQSIALLRGINVGTANRIRMEDLRRLFMQAGFLDVETYIQSGNVLFASDLSEDAARGIIEELLAKGAGIKTTVVLRSGEELASIPANCPFSAEEIAQAQQANTEGESFHVCLLPQAPSPDALSKLESLPLEGDRFILAGRDLYLLLCRSIRVSKLAIKLQKLFPDATVRNWNTLTRLHELSAKQTEGAV